MKIQPVGAVAGHHEAIAPPKKFLNEFVRGNETLFGK